MKYLSANEMAELLGISKSMVRKYCAQNRMPGAKKIDGEWMIPANLDKPEAESFSPVKMEKLPPLARKVKSQKKRNNFHGLYDYIQINSAYSSSRMASNRLTRKQVESIFRKGKVKESFEPMKVSDLIEVMNHFVCMDYIIDHLEKPLSVKFIKQLHEMLMYGTVDSRLEKVFPGEFRNSRSKRKERFFFPASEINDRLGRLIKEYEAQDEIERREILHFHVQFERIFPFEDGNGRVGRLIMFKECLRHEVVPFILDDKKRAAYLDGLREWDEDPGIMADIVLDAQERFQRQIELQILRAYGYAFDPKRFEEDDFDD